MITPSATTIRSWRESPRKFAYDNFGFVPDAWQGEALDLLASPLPEDQHIGMKACAGPGKSAVLALSGWWFLATQGDIGQHPKGVAVSITRENLRDNLWAEFAKWRNASPYLTHAFRWTAERVFAKDHPETWFIAARGFSKKANADEQGRTLSGLHSEYIFYVIDEGGDIPVPVIKASEQGLSNCKFGKVMMAGNPTSLQGALHHVATELREQWRIIEITGDPDDKRRSPRINKEWAREQIKLYGRDNPWVMAYILGQFPPSSINTLLGPDDVTAAFNRHLVSPDYDWAQKRTGTDVAREGDDMSVIFKRQGLMSYPAIKLRNLDSFQLSSRLANEKVRFDSELDFVDNTGGWGGGVVDACKQANMPIVAINFSSKPDDPRYYNKRAEMWFRLAKWIKEGGALALDDQLLKELTTPTYTFKNGKFLMEEKKQIKARLGFSPDIADAAALTFARAEMPRKLLLRQRAAEKAAPKVYDPFEDLDPETSGQREGRVPL